MNFKTTYLLFGVLAVMIGVIAFALWYDPTARSESSKYVLPVLQDKSRPVKVEDIDRVEIERRDQDKLVLVRDPSGDRWSIVEPKELRADKVAVNHLLSQIFDATREEKVTAPPNLATWGLEPPEQTITFNKGNELSFKLLVGKLSPGETDAVIYVLDPARPKEPMAVKKGRLDAVLTPLAGFRDTELLASSPGNIKTVALAKGKETVAWKKDDRDRWVYTDPKNYGEAASGFEDTGAAGQAKKAPGSIDTVLTDITNLKVEKAGGTPEFLDNVNDFAQYELDPDKALRVEVTRRDAGKDADGKPQTRTVEATLYVGKNADDKGEKRYARLEVKGEKAGGKTVVKVAAKYVEPLAELLARPDALRDRTLVRLDGQPSAVRIKNGYGEFELFRAAAAKPQRQFDLPGADQWTLWRDGAPRKVDAGVMQAPTSLVKLLLQKAQPPVIEGFIDPKDKDDQAKKERELGLDRPRAVVSLWSDEDGVKAEAKADDKDADKKDEKKDDKKKPQLKSDEPTYRLSFGDPVSEGEKRLVAVKREVRRKDGWDVTLVKIAETALDEARKGPLAYMDRTLERFSDSGLPPWKGVTKVVIQRGNTAVEAAREKDDAPWKIVRPTEQAGRNAETGKIDDLLRSMNRLTAQQLAAEKATDEELDKKYGLKAPQARVEITVKKDDKPVTYAYEFGRESESGGGVYAKQSQRDTIFTVDKTAVSGLPTDIMDPVLFTLDADKVRKVKLTGWQKLVGSPLTLEFERKDKSSPWEVKKGPDKFKLDGGKVDTLLDDLRTCRAERFVEFKSGPKPKYKLDPADDALVIEITVEGEEKPLTLTVGAPSDDDKGYYAMTSRTDGDVVVLFKGTFARPKKEGSGYFSQ
jgi:hypothetical protein